jgi:hypothetical protein
MNENLEQLRGLLDNARRMFLLRSAARTAAAIGLAVLLAEIGLGFFFWKQNPATWSEIMRYVPTGLALTILGAVVGVLVAWKRHRALEAVAERAQKEFPELGLRISASIEAPRLEYCPPAIRNALWQDTLARVGRTPWKQFTRRASAIKWAALLLVLFLFHLVLTFPRPVQRALPKQLEKLVENVQDQIAGRPSRPSLEITEPARDQWATKMESIPVTVQSPHPEELANLRFEVSVNGEPAKEIPVENAKFDEKTGETTASLDLAQLKLKDYDVVSYRMVADVRKEADAEKRADSQKTAEAQKAADVPKAGETQKTAEAQKAAEVGKTAEPQKAEDAPKRGEAKEEVASQTFFVQVEPIRGDVPVAETMVTDGMRRFVDLVNLLAEEQRQVLRDTAKLKTLDPQSAEFRETLKATIEAQKRITERARAAFEQAAKEFGNAVSKEMLLDLDETRTHMENALKNLEKNELDAAQTEEHKALTGLSDILRDIDDAERQAEEQMIAAAQNPQNAAAAPAPQLLAPNAPDLEQLAQQQGLLNRDAEALQDRVQTLAPPDAQAQQQALAGRQQDILRKTETATPEKSASEAIRQPVEEAKAAMKQNAENLLAPPSSAPQASPPSSQTPQPSQPSPPGQSNRSPGKKAQQLLEQAAARNIVEKQMQQAAELRQMLQQLGSRQGELQRGEASTPEKQAATAKTLAAMKEQLKAMAERPLATAPRTLKEASQKSEEAAKPFAENKGNAETLTPVQEAVAQAYDQTLGRVAHLAQLQQDLQRIKEQVESVQQKMAGQQAKSSTDPNAPPGQNPSDGKAAVKAGEGTPSPTDAQAKAAAEQTNQGMQQWMKSIEDRSGTLEIELRTSLGLTEGMKQLEQVFKKNRQPLKGPVNSWTIYGGPYANIGDWIKAISRVQTEMDAQVQSVSQADLLGQMKNEDAPPEYRDLVNAYFERLSREPVKPEPAKPNP